MRDRLERLSDCRLWLLLGATLFMTAAWPLLLVRWPPLQDLPNHLATAVVLSHPDRYPELAFNGFLKTNSALFAWLHFIGGVIGLSAAAKAFVVLVLGANALVLPRVVLELGGRKRMLVATLFAWPMVHNWFVSMGMLDYALGTALALVLLLVARRQTLAPSVGKAVLLAALGVLVWYAHAFALVLVGLVLVVDLAFCRERRARAAAMLGPLVPAVALVVWSVVLQLRSRGPTAEYAWAWSPPWELGYQAWAEYLWAFTKATLSTVVVAVVLGVVAIRRWRAPAPLLSPAVFVVLFALYVFLPYHAANWFHVGSRLLPLLWVCALVRVPQSLPRPLALVLGASWAAYSVGLGWEYARLDAAWSRFASGTSVVPEGARLLPLVFRDKTGSENTRNMLHAWGLYVAERRTSAPLVFAHSRSFPITYRELPPPQLNQLYLEGFARTMDRPERACGDLRAFGVVPDCTVLYDGLWREFWETAEPRFEWVLTWGASPDALARIPPSYALVYERDELRLYAR